MSVWMRHPDLPGQPIEVAELSVPHYQASGWEVGEAPAKPARKKPAPATGASEEVSAPVVEEVSEAAPDKPARRRAPKEAE